MYGEISQAAAVRAAINHDLYFAQIIEAGDKIQVVKKDGTIETIMFVEWLQLMLLREKF